MAQTVEGQANDPGEGLIADAFWFNWEDRLESGSGNETEFRDQVVALSAASPLLIPQTSHKHPPSACTHTARESTH